MKGCVVRFNRAKGYGFIKTKQMDKDIFFHISHVKNNDRLFIGGQVEFEVLQSKKGPEAVSVLLKTKQSSPFLRYGLVSIILCLLFSIYFAQKMDFFMSYFCAINLVIFILYGYDKIIAGSDKLRVPENIFHFLALIGATPAAFVAQIFFRHKTLKGSFQAMFWMIALLQIGSIWALTQTFFK